jgi:hypothetical protein
MIAMCEPSTYGNVFRYFAASAKSWALVFTELLVDDFHEVAAVVVRAAIVDVDDDVAFLGEPLLPAGGVELIVDAL